MYFGLRFTGAAHQDWEDDRGGSLRQLLSLFLPFVVVVVIVVFTCNTSNLS